MAIDAILDHFGLTGDQRRAAAERQRDVTVTAGAGSGKTRTLVARYVGLLSEGCAPRQVAAITFTEKAAREMRTRVRQELRQMALAAESLEARMTWTEIEAQMDSARIGTIHSLCTEILRAHPAEAGLDPQFGVADESEAFRLRSAAVEAALLWAVEEPEMRPLFEAFSVGRLEGILNLLMSKRLEVSPVSLDSSAGEGILIDSLGDFLQQHDVCAILEDFRFAKQDGSLLADAGDKLADQIARLLVLWEEANLALGARQGIRCAKALWQARQSEMALNIGKRTSTNKESLRDLRTLFDLQLGPWLGGKEAIDEQTETHIAALTPLLKAVYTHALEAYRSALDERQALDFDDLESGALTLLQQPSVAAQWQSEIVSVLVDEFQDTNARQRQMVQLLCGEYPGRLFVVGDARQSIYRFRGADVTVFTNLLQAVRQRGGLTLDLDRTFRAHAPLLTATGSLLAATMGDQPDPQRPFFVPFSPLQPQREMPREGGQAPFVECILGVGEDSESGRRAAARALAQRLHDLRQAGEIQSWDEVALLFRASTGFPFYEEAFEVAGIPFVTVAGSGFYDRPEVRDVLNLLRALSDPWDDQALAGFLRSPAIGLSDPALYLLRYREGQYLPLRQSLDMYATQLAAMDHPAAERALAILQEFEPLVDRLPVAELLRRLIARIDILAILAGTRSRLWRNVGKLLTDAQRSGLVRVRAFLEYIDTLRDIGAREGEAISEVEGAIRLMTIHKSKGLEFPVVVLADAARQSVGGGSVANYLSGEAGHEKCWAFAPDRTQSTPLLYRLAKYRDAQQEDAESGRLLYVAMTRAKEKLLVSGHITVKEDGSWRSNGWLQALFETGGADIARCLSEPGIPFIFPLASGGSWRLWLGPQEGENRSTAPEMESVFPDRPVWPEANAQPLAEPLIEPQESLQPAETQEVSEWHIDFRQSPALIVGNLVHEVLRDWRFEDEGSIDQLLRRLVRQKGMEAGEDLEEVIHISKILLLRFQRHPIWLEIQNASERYHAIPLHEKDGTAYIDLLYRTESGWNILDFHTGSLKGEAAVQAALEMRRPGLLEKLRAVQTRLGVLPRGGVCFLDVSHQVVICSESVTNEK